ncbi:golgin subfamily A member 3-like isoform X1 [Gadus macrocephalus]|uniref:golgin subfamily A member 3-like isoform X1 n=1 Tax=Gadus macrocephalus TaxID=80720 RepID=UPI0028CB6294|nr:golgin subfamily A member 3-like isoform X1 [Gadus macrocephalus]
MRDHLEQDSLPVKGHGNPISHECLGHNGSRCSSVASGLNGSDTSIFLTKLHDEIDFGAVDERVQERVLQTKVKGHVNPISHECLGHNGSRCSSVGSRLNGSETSIFLTKLHDEIDFGEVVDEMVQERFLQTKVEPFLEKLHQQATNVVVSYNDMDEKELKRYQQTRHVILHVPTLQELLLKIGFSKNMEDLQSYLIAADRTCLLSENEALKLELNDAQSRHQTVVSGLHSSLQSVEDENKGAQYTLHQDIRRQQDRVILTEGKLSESERQVISLQRYLLESTDKAQILQKTLSSCKSTLQSAEQDMELTKQRGLDLEAAHRASQDNNQSLRRSLLGAEEHAKSLRHSVGELERKIELQQKNQASEEEAVKSLRRRVDESEEKVSSLEGSLKASEESVSSLRQSLRASEEKAACLGQSQRTSEERCRSLQLKLNSAEEAVRATRGSLAVAESEAERLKEALGSLEDKTLALQDTLLASESHSSGGAAQRRALERGKTEDRESLQVLIRSLVGCEEEHRSRAKRLDLELRLTRERLALLQDSGSRTESRHAQETARLQHQLLKTANKGTAAQKELRAHVAELNTKLLKAQASQNRELEGVAVVEKELRDTILDLRQELHVQTKEKEGALQCLRMRQRDLAEVQHHLQVDLLKCTHGREPERGRSTPREAEQRVEPDTPKATLRSVDHEHVLTDGQRKKESAKVHGHGHSVREGRRDDSPCRPPRSAWRDTPPPPADSPAPSCDSTGPSLPWSNRTPLTMDGKGEACCLTQLKPTEYLQNLLKVQKKLRALQSMDCQKTMNDIRLP